MLRLVVSLIRSRTSPKQHCRNIQCVAAERELRHTLNRLQGQSPRHQKGCIQEKRSPSTSQMSQSTPQVVRRTHTSTLQSNSIFTPESTGQAKGGSQSRKSVQDDTADGPVVKDSSKSCSKRTQSSDDTQGACHRSILQSVIGQGRE